MPLDISKIRGRVEAKLRARGLSTLPWPDEKWIEEASVDLRSRYLRGAKLRGANLAGADLHGVDLAEADLSDADLSRANLSGANLSRANLSHVNIAGANLAGTNLERVILQKFRGLNETNWESAANTNGTVLGIASYLAAYELYSNSVNHFRPKGYQGTEKPLRTLVENPWSYLIGVGRTAVDYILDKLVVPPNQTKSFEVAARLVKTSGSNPPRNVFTWWDENEGRLALIANGYLYWPERTEGTKELFRVGSFSVHNTINLKGAKLNQIKEILETAEATLAKNCIPDLDKTLYGDVYLVPQIQAATTIAWYNIDADKVYLRSTKNDKWNELEGIIHELGHRYWNKIAPEQKKAAWGAWYKKQKNATVEIPKPGDVCEAFNVSPETQGQGLATITVLAVETGFNRRGQLTGEIKLEVRTETKIDIGYIPLDKLEQNWGTMQNFPSSYAAKDAEECFCETLAFYAMGVLPAKYATPFRAIWGTG
jgi:uncharacterized protein YjbI with pentapeptide repeats